MKNIIWIILLISFTSCQKWLDVKPEDKFIEDDAFSNPQGIANALNGIYLKLGASNMYGGELTMNFTDLLSQYYYISTGHAETLKQLVQYNFEDNAVKARIDNIWKNQFANITNVNKFIENIEKRIGILDQQTHDIYLGEAYALRAYLYFDILRFFAPNYQLDPKAERIPFYEKAGYEIQPFSTSEYIVNRILQDLTAAETLLIHDPVLNMQQVDIPIGAIPDNLWKLRNGRMNFYAVKGLQARVLLYSGDKQGAYQAAMRVIQDKAKFPWIKADQVNNNRMQNRVFSTENIFQFENPKLYEYYNSYFGSALLDQSILLSAGPDQNFLNLIFDNWENDFRYSPSWSIEGGKTFPLFVKYKDVENKTLCNFRYKVPGIKLSEIYLIAAEAEIDQTKALGYINELREHRNCLPITSTTNIQDDILEEFRREFYGEGQLWFFYKRKNMSNIISASNSQFIKVETDQFTFPIPLSETEQR